MIEYLKKDLTTVNHGVIAHGCNCRGKQGAGIALAIRKRWPYEYDRYLLVCKKIPAEDLLGEVQFVDVESTEITKVYVANMFTQLNYGRDNKRYADPEAIENALYKTLTFCKERQLPLYMSKIGCSLGGLNWEREVLPIVEELDKRFEIPIFVCSC